MEDAGERVVLAALRGKRYLGRLWALLLGSLWLLLLLELLSLLLLLLLLMACVWSAADDRD